MKQNILLVLFFAALTSCYGAVLKKEIAVDTTLIYQEGNYEYDVNLSQLAVFEFGTVHPNWDLSRVILILHNDSKDTLFVRKMKQEGIHFTWRYQPFEKIAPRDTVELRIDFEKNSFTTFNNQFEFSYRLGRTKSFFSLKTSGSMGKGNALRTFVVPPKIQVMRIENDSLSPIRYNGERVNETNKQGFKEGKWVFFYADGTVKKIATYFNGYEVGELFIYYPAGNLNTHKNYDKHVDLYYAEEGSLFVRAVPDSLIYYYPSGKIKQLNIEDRIYYWEESGSPTFYPKNRHAQALHNDERVLETTYYENGNLRERHYLDGKTIYYSENQRDCIVKIDRASSRTPRAEFFYKNCELDYIDVYSYLSDPYQPKIPCVRNERGEFKNEKLVNGSVTVLNLEGDTLFARNTVHGQVTSDVFFQQQHYNFTDALGRKQGTWIYNSPHSQTWSDYAFPIVFQKFVYKNDTLQYPFYHYYETGEVSHIYTKGINNTNQNYVNYSRKGNVIGESIDGIYYGYADSTVRIQTAYHNGSKMKFDFKNGKLIRRSTPKQEDYYSLEEPGWRNIPYTVSEGTFRNYHIYNGTIKFYDKQRQLIKSLKVVNGAINGDQIVILKDAFLEQELLFQTGIDVDDNGYITKSEAKRIKRISIDGMRIRDVSDFRNFTSLQELWINHCQIDPTTFKSPTRLLEAIKKAQATPYNPLPQLDWRDIDIEPDIFIEVKMEQHEIIDFPEQDASFPGGEDSLKAYITKNLRYPSSAKENNDQGVVYIRFVINLDGSICAIEVMRGVSTEIDNEAIRLIKEMPNWIPAKNHGKAVRTRFIYPISFKLD
jgi:TonB family protein